MEAANSLPSCLKAISAALLAKDADKLTLGQHVTVIAPHALCLLLNDRVTFAPPATLLPLADDSTPVHQCSDILAEEAETRKDLTDQLWPGVPAWYTDESNFVVEGRRRAGAAVVNGKQTISMGLVTNKRACSPQQVRTLKNKKEILTLLEAIKSDCYPLSEPPKGTGA